MDPITLAQVIDGLVTNVAQDIKLVEQLQRSFISEERDHLTAAMWKLLPVEHQPMVKDVYGAFLTYCADHKEDVPLRINLALKMKTKDGSAYKHRRDRFGMSVGLFPKARGQVLSNVPTIYLSKRKKAYPPRGQDIYETFAARELWECFRNSTDYPDTRGGRTWKPFQKLNPIQLQHTVHQNESAIIRDKKTADIIGIVIRNFSGGNQHLLDWINGVIAENTGVRRSVRLEDPGHLCQIGYTSGARSSPQLGWARNLLRKETKATTNRLMYESSSVFALFWNLLRNQLPEDIIGDFDSWLQENQMVRMDTGGSQDAVEGKYTVRCGDEPYTFHGVEMPPPSGVFGTNYSRFIHREKSCHKYAVAWTTMRDPQLGVDGGGHFFICSHAIKVEAGTDTVVVWQPRSWHGTSLQQWDPVDPKIFQAGLAIVTPPGVAKLWAEVRDKKISLEEAKKRVLELESGELDE